MRHVSGTLWEFGNERERTLVDLAAVNAVVEGANDTHRLHLRGDKEGFPVVAFYGDLRRAIVAAKDPFTILNY